MAVARKAAHGIAKQSGLHLGNRVQSEGLCLSMQGNAPHCKTTHGTAPQCIAKKRGQPFTEGCPRFFESQCTALHGNALHSNAMQSTAWQRTAEQRRAMKRGQHLESGCCPSRIGSQTKPANAGFFIKETQWQFAPQ